MADYVMTVDSDTEEPSNPTKGVSDDLNPEFVFDLSADAYGDLLSGHTELQDVVKTGSKPVRPPLQIQCLLHYLTVNFHRNLSQ